MANSSCLSSFSVSSSSWTGNHLGQVVPTEHWNSTSVFGLPVLGVYFVSISSFGDVVCHHHHQCHPPGTPLLLEQVQSELFLTRTYSGAGPSLVTSDNMALVLYFLVDSLNGCLLYFHHLIWILLSIHLLLQTRPAPSSSPSSPYEALNKDLHYLA